MKNRVELGVLAATSSGALFKSSASVSLGALVLPTAGLEVSRWPASKAATAKGVSCRKSVLRLIVLLVIDVKSCPVHGRGRRLSQPRRLEQGIGQS